MSRLRAVVDTNCYISAIVHKGFLTGLRAAWESGLFVPVLCAEAMAELEEVLGYPKFDKMPSELKAKALSGLRSRAETFVLSHSLAPVPGLRDPKDMVFVNLARESKADCLVSGDVHLLELRGTIPDVKIVTPREFLGKLEKA